MNCFLPPAYPQNVKNVTNVFLVCVFCTSAYVLYDQNTVIIYVNLTPNFFSSILHARMLLVISINFSRVFLLTCFFNVPTILCQTIFILESSNLE